MRNFDLVEGVVKNLNNLCTFCVIRVALYPCTSRVVPIEFYTLCTEKKPVLKHFVALKSLKDL